MDELLDVAFVSFLARRFLQQLLIQHRMQLSTMIPWMDKPTISIIWPAESLWLSTSIKGTLAPIVVLTHTKNVLFSPAGKGESCERGHGAVSLFAGMFAGNDAVLL